MELKKQKNTWSDTDETKLLKFISEDVPLDKITKKLKKKEKEVIHKLKKIALKMCNEKKTKDNIKKTLKFLSDEQIFKIFKHFNEKKPNNTNPNPNENTNETDNFSEFGIGKKQSTLNNNNSLIYPNNIISILNKINDKIDLIINTSAKNTNFTNKQNFKLKTDNESSINNEIPIQNNKINENSQTVNNKTKNTKSDVSDSSSDNDDTDDIINMIKRNKGGGR
jgi:hypothetical protein